MNPATIDEKPSPAALERRRAASRRLGWQLGLTALLWYIVGLFIER
ncbi:MAG: hypothetical protein H6R15_303 [Proteobacteria bacterium]|nr:hypothetical protein [Pseudomonadota bacterium]